jgi:hypothetical protein
MLGNKAMLQQTQWYINLHTNSNCRHRKNYVIMTSWHHVTMTHLARVDDVSDVGDRQRRFRNVCRHNTKAMAGGRGLEDQHLLGLRKHRVEREDMQRLRFLVRLHPLQMDVVGVSGDVCCYVEQVFPPKAFL